MEEGEAHYDPPSKDWGRLLKENALLILVVGFVVVYSLNLKGFSKESTPVSHEEIVQEMEKKHALDDLQGSLEDGTGEQQVDSQVELKYGPAGSPVIPDDDLHRNAENIDERFWGSDYVEEDMVLLPGQVPGLIPDEQPAAPPAPEDEAPPPPAAEAPADGAPAPPPADGAPAPPPADGAPAPPPADGAAPPPADGGPINAQMGGPVQYSKIETKPAPADIDVDILLSSPLANRMIVSEELKCMYCPLPKVACSNWKSMFRKFAGFDNFKNLAIAHNREESGLKYLKDFSPDEVRAMLQDPEMLKFVVVRNPFSRLLSAYLDKFKSRETDSPEFMNFFDQLVGYKYRKDFGTAFRPTFSQYLEYIGAQDVMAMNEHWAPQTLLCNIDSFPYDFIGRFETYGPDSQRVLTTIGKEDEQFPTPEQIGFNSMGTAHQVGSAYNETEVALIVDKFEEDFRVLNYAKTVEAI